MIQILGHDARYLEFLIDVPQRQQQQLDEFPRGRLPQALLGITKTEGKFKDMSRGGQYGGLKFEG